MSTSRPLCLAFLLLLVPGVGRAHSLSDELSLGGTSPTPQNPRSGSASDTLSGLVDVSEAISLRLDLGFIHDNATKAQSGATFGSTGGNVFAGALAVDWSASEHWDLGAQLDLSPRSQQYSNSIVTYTNPQGQAASTDALIKTGSSSGGLSLSGGYLTGGESNFELAVDGSLGLTTFSSTQQLQYTDSKQLNQFLGELVSFCESKVSNPGTPPRVKAFCTPLLSSAAGAPAHLTQARLSLGGTATLFTDTDVGVSGTYYVYDKDPAKVGYFSLFNLGQQALKAGNGITAVAPLLYSVRPTLAHRFGPLSLDLFYQYGVYADDQGVSSALGLRAQYRFNKHFKLWSRISQQVDTDAAGTSTRSGTFSLGVRASF